MKRIRFIGLISALLAHITMAAQEPSLKVSSKRQVAVGEQFRIAFEANSEGKKFTAPSFEGFSVVGGPFNSSSSSVQIVNGSMTRSVSNTYTFVLRAEKEGTFTVDLDCQQAVVELADVEIISEDIPGWLVANEGNLTVALDITVTDELRLEGIARELVNRIQNVRKSKNFDITDKITITIAPDERTDEAVKAYGDYIAHQVLATSIKIAPVNEATAVELDMDGWTLLVNVDKV